MIKSKTLILNILVILNFELNRKKNKKKIEWWNDKVKYINIIIRERVIFLLIIIKVKSEEKKEKFVGDSFEMHFLFNLI